MNSNIKITLELDGSRAFEVVDELEARLNDIVNKEKNPIALDEMSDFGNVSYLIKEMRSAGGGLSGGEKSGYEKRENDFVKHQEKLTSIEKKYSAQRIKYADDENRGKLVGAEMMLLSAESLFGKQALLYKTISIAEATISAYNAANAALLPPPIGAGPILGEIQAGIVLMNSLKRVEKIAATQIQGYAKGGIVVGENGPEVIENMQDYASGRAELIQKTILALQTSPGFSGGVINEIRNLRSDLNKVLDKPSIAFLDDKEAKKVYYRGQYIARKTR